MKVHVHVPPANIEVPDLATTVFLAGPIAGAPEWQNKAINIFGTLDGDEELHILNPRRFEVDDDFTDEDYKIQTAWEKTGLKRAAKLGSSLIFWFAAQDHSRRYPEGRKYAKTTQKELDRAFGWKDYNPKLNISIGADPDFEGLERYTRTCIEEFGLPVFPTLEETCVNALKQIREVR